MVINMALRYIHWLVFRLCRLKLGECVIIHWDAGSVCKGRRVRAQSASPQFGKVPGTNCNFDGSLPRDKQNNGIIFIAVMPFLDECITVSNKIYTTIGEIMIIFAISESIFIQGLF
jgi:hypothetical protein